MYSLAQSQHAIKIDIETQKKHIRPNAPAEAPTSMTIQNQTEHTHRLRNAKQFLSLTSITTEIESENSLAFLDVLVTHEGTNFSTSLYRKKTFTGLYTDFASLSPDKYKANLISVLVYRAFHICSTYQNFHDEIVRIKEILFKNCFPRSLTDRIIKSFLDKRFAPRPPAPQEAQNGPIILYTISRQV